MFALLKQSDARAVRQVLRGRRDQFDTLVNRYLPAVYAVSYAQLRNHADAEDVAQEAFLTAFTSLHTLREPHKFEGWVVSMARRIAVHLRQKRQHEYAVNGIKAGEAVVVPDVAREELRQLLRQEIDRLNDDEREVLLLHYFTGKNTGEVAVALDIGREAAKKRLQRARQQLSDNMLRQVKDETNPRTSFGTQRSTISGLILMAVAPWDNAVAAHFPALSAGLTKLSAIAAFSVLLLACSAYVLFVEPASDNEQFALNSSQESRQAVIPDLQIASTESTYLPDNDRLNAAIEVKLDNIETTYEAETALSGPWRFCDNLATSPGINAVFIVVNGQVFSLHIPEGGKAGAEFASGTVSGGKISVCIGTGVEERRYSGVYSDPERFVLTGVYVEQEIAREVEIAFSRLDARDLSELEIQDRRCSETTQVAEAIQGYFKDNGSMPESLADIVPQYLKSAQFAESNASRRITYIPDGTGSLAEINEYPNARTHQERLLKQEADRLAAWPTFPSKPPMLTIQYAVPPMTIISYMVELPKAVRIDLGSPMSCPRSTFRSDANDAVHLKKCEGNMKELGDVLRVFASGDRERRYPGGFGVTVPTMMVNGAKVVGLFDTMALTCPSLGEEDVPGRTESYSLLFPTLNEAELRAIAIELGIEADNDAYLSSKIPIVVEIHECSNKSGSHVAFVDGHVELLQPQDWQARVAPFVEYAENYYAGL